MPPSHTTCLYLDFTTFQGGFVVGLMKLRAQHITLKRYHCGTEYFLKRLDVLLAQKHIERDSLRGIIVVLGDGSFSAVRMAVMYGNLLAYSLEIPVVSVPSKASSSSPPASFEVYKKEYFPCFMEQGAPLLKNRQPRASQTFISPTYSREPHITYPRA